MLSVTGAASLLVIVLTASLFRWLLSKDSTRTKSLGEKTIAEISVEPNRLSQNLIAALGDRVLLPRNTTAFSKSVKRHWSHQETDVIPARIVQPRNADEVSTTVKILNRAVRGDNAGSEDSLFAVRSGGHSWVTGASAIRGGTLIDLSLICDVELSEDKTSAVIGTGARWGGVTKVLEKDGVAVAGGRNSDVGVGGFLLGGGLSFLAPRFGWACSNVISYEIVLSSGSVVIASENSRSDLWRALKGGANNFGIVTRFTVRCFPQGDIWAGWLFLPSFESKRSLSAFYDFVRSADPTKQNTTYDENAAGPMTGFSYFTSYGLDAIAIHLAYMDVSDNKKGWPAYWKATPFTSLWRFRSTCKIRTLSNSTDELFDLNGLGKRQDQTTTTVKNDMATLTAAHAIYREGAASLRRAGAKGVLWTLLVQPLFPKWTRKGDPNPMGLDDCQDPLVIVIYVASWSDPKVDEIVRKTTRLSIEKLEAVAAANGTGHPFKYLNYCGDGQRPFQSYGEEGLEFLKSVSRKYDPDRMFQKQCIGGFKLDSDSRH